jgi:hypothetical protein
MLKPLGTAQRAKALCCWLIYIQKYACQKIGCDQGQQDQRQEESNDGVIARIEDWRWWRVHHIARSRENLPQDNNGPLPKVGVGQACNLTIL